MFLPCTLLNFLFMKRHLFPFLARLLQNFFVHQWTVLIEFRELAKGSQKGRKRVAKGLQKGSKRVAKQMF
jgi:hypothetical protein